MALLVIGGAKLHIYLHYVPEDNFTLRSFSTSPSFYDFWTPRALQAYLGLHSTTGLLRTTQVLHNIHYHLKFSRVIFEKLPSMMRLHSKCLYVPAYTTLQFRKEPHYATYVCLHTYAMSHTHSQACRFNNNSRTTSERLLFLQYVFLIFKQITSHSVAP